MARAGAEDRLNVVFILADDLGWSQLSAYGSAFYRTPNIDRIASKGLRFTNAYAAAAVCSPTRASIMTGKYPARLHLTDYIPGASSSEHLLRPPRWTKYLPLEEHTIGEVFQDAGYRTAFFGKWHLSKEKQPPESLPFNPDRQGFDETLVTYKPSSTPNRPKPWQSPEDDGHNVREITERALQFLDHNDDEPFFLFVSHNSIHDPLMEKAATISRYSGSPLVDRPENHAVIGAMVETLDRSVGLLLDRLDSLNLTEKTVVIFFSDNGGRHAYARQIPFRAGKGWLYEGGIRTPLIVYWPGLTPAGGVSDTIVSSVDFFPTLAALAGAVPRSSVDGLNIAPVFRGQRLDRDAIYWHYPHYHEGSGMRPAGAIRAGEYKLVEWFEDGRIELYNLVDDPGESINLAHTKPEVASVMLARLKTWREGVGAQMPVRKGPRSNGTN